MKTNFIIHDNSWWWGRTINIISDDGLAHLLVQFDKDYPETAFLRGLMVHPSARRKGIGTELMKEAERISRENGIKEMELDADLKAGWLVGWYERLGFGEILMYEYEVKMKKFL